MTLWVLLAIVFVAGAVGGVINAWMSDNGFMLPRTEESGGNRFIRPGFLGNIITGGVAACVSWGLYGPFAAAYVVGGPPSGAAGTELGLTLSSLVGALLVGVGGARWLTERGGQEAASRRGHRVGLFAGKPRAGGEDRVRLTGCRAAHGLRQALVALAATAATHSPLSQGKRSTDVTALHDGRSRFPLPWGEGQGRGPQPPLLVGEGGVRVPRTPTAGTCRGPLLRDGRRVGTAVGSNRVHGLQNRPGTWVTDWFTGMGAGLGSARTLSSFPRKRESSHSSRVGRVCHARCFWSCVECATAGRSPHGATVG